MGIVRFSILAILVCRLGLAYQVELKELNQTKSEIVISATEADLNFQTLATDGVNFLKVNLGESITQDNIGSPDLPRVRRWLVVDEKASFVPTVTYEGERTLDNVVVYPIQPLTLDNGQKLPFAYNKAAYTSKKTDEDSIQILPKAKLGNLTILPIDVSPLKYDGKTLKVFTKVRVTLDWKNRGATQFTTTQFISRQAAALTLNGATAFRAGKRARYLIAAPKELMSHAKELGKVTESSEGAISAYLEVPVGVQAKELQKLIKGQYGDAPLDMVLLFGDAKKIPLHVQEGNPGDVFYSLLAGSDDIADVGLGRLPVANVTEAKAIVEKIRRYRQMYAAGHRESKVMLIAHEEDYPNKYTKNMEEIRKLPNTKNFDYVTQYGGEKATSDSVVDAQGKGFAIINYRGHGSDTTWWQWGKDRKDLAYSHLDKFSDKDVDMSFIFNVCCDSGNIEHSSGGLVKKELFPGGTFRGAIGVLGSTRPSYTEVNHRFNLHLFTYLQQTTAPHIGDMYAYANNKLVQQAGGNAPENVYMYLLLSDPSLVPWI
jgi:hypothetical protein